MRILKSLAVLLLMTLAFGGGYVLRATKSAAPTSNTRTVLYYVDPMHPAYTSDRPGVAPDCGMTLEPVYADAGAAAGPTGTAATAPPVPGAIQIAPERQQLIG